MLFGFAGFRICRVEVFSGEGEAVGDNVTEYQGHS